MTTERRGNKSGGGEAKGGKRGRSEDDERMDRTGELRIC